MLPKRLCTLALAGVSLSIILGVAAVLGFLSASAGEPVGVGSDEAAVGAVQVSQPVPAVHKLPRVAIGAIPPSGVHLVSPREDVVKRHLGEQGVIPAGATSEQAQMAVDRWYRGFKKESHTWVSPQVRESALRREADLADPGVSVQAIQPVTATVLVMAVDFGASETIQASVVGASGQCVTQSATINGPLKGNIPHPGAQDNNTVWYSPTLTVDAAYYGNLVFGYAGVGRVRYDMTDPGDGQPGIDLSGRTVQDYYDHVAGKDNVIITGTVEDWVTVNHSEGHYGAPDCNAGEFDGGDGVPVAQLVIDAVDVFSQTHPTYYWDTSPSAFWPQYDADGNGIVDSFWLIHAGMGQEAEGGAEGQFAIWSHSSDLRNYAGWHDGYQVYEGDPDDPDDDIFVGPYTMQPEDAGMGVLAEEFGHSFFGLPDLHTLDEENSVGFWSTMAPGVWGGHLGASAPVGMSLWLRMMAWCGDQYCNWQEPMLTRDYYDDPAADITIGQLEETPNGVRKGVRVNLPDFVDEIPNRAGTGKGAYTYHGRDGVDLTLDRQIAVGSSAPAVLSFDSHWDIEEGWDYGYVMVNGTALADMDGHFTGAGSLGPGLTGSGGGVLRFDLSAYRGQTVNLSLRYVTDQSISGTGWWVDNVRLDGAVVDDFSGASAPDSFPGWSNSDPGWMMAPTTVSHVNYYLVEWRAPTKYDSMLRTAYVTAYSNRHTNEWRVERVPYNIPGALVYYRNRKYRDTGELAPNQYNLPSVGPKYQLLVVDMNYRPMRLGETGPYSTTVLNARRSSYDAALTLQPTDAFTINQAQIDDTVLTGPWHYASKPAVSRFNDVLGYYAGFYSGDPCPAGSLCFADEFGSAVIPARDRYSTRVTDFSGSPLTDLYGQVQSTPGDGFRLGSGNPGDDSVQYGVNIELLSKAGDDSTALLRFRNFSVDVITGVSVAFPSDARSFEYELTYRTAMENNGKETTQNMPFTYTLDSLLSLQSIDTGAGLLAAERATDVWAAGGQVVTGSTPSLAPGSVVTITLVATGNITPGTTVTTRLDVYDGQVPRGPWFFHTTPTRLILPQIFKHSPMW